MAKNAIKLYYYFLTELKNLYLIKKKAFFKTNYQR